MTDPRRARWLQALRTDVHALCVSTLTDEQWARAVCTRLDNGQCTDPDCGLTWLFGPLPEVSNT